MAGSFCPVRGLLADAAKELKEGGPKGAPKGMLRGRTDLRLVFVH